MEGTPSQYLSYALVLMLIGSVFSVVLPSVQMSHAASEDITVNVAGDDVTTTYDPRDTVAVEGKVADVVSGKTVSIRITDPSGSADSTTTTPDEDSGEFDYAYDIPSGADDGVWTVKVT